MKKTKRKGRCGPVPCSALDLLILTFSGSLTISSHGELQPEKQGLYPLHVAEEQGHCEVVRLLVSAGADVNLMCKMGMGWEHCNDDCVTPGSQADREVFA